MLLLWVLSAGLSEVVVIVLFLYASPSILCQSHMSTQSCAGQVRKDDHIELSVQLSEMLCILRISKIHLFL